MFRQPTPSRDLLSDFCWAPVLGGQYAPDSEPRETAVKVGQATGKSSQKGANTKAAEEATTFLRDYFSNQTNAEGLGQDREEGRGKQNKRHAHG